MKKLFAIFLTIVMLLSLFPVAIAATPDRQKRDIWEVISDIESNAADSLNAASFEALTYTYSNAIDEIIDAVTASSSYVPGTLERHGDFFFWIDKNGDPNGYSPSLRAKQRLNAVSGAEPQDFAATEIVDYSKKGGWSSSVHVAAFQPFIGIDSSFTAQYENRCKAIAQATGGTGTTYKTTDANINNLGLALSTCSVVIFDSHGTTDYDDYSNDDYTSKANSSYICLTSGTGITEQDKQSATGEFGTYYHAFRSGSYWCVDGTAICNHMTADAPNNMVWMAICLGMATSGMETPFREHGVEVVYGYSQSVSFTGDYKYDGFFWPYMCENKNVADAAAYMKTKANCDWDPAYSGYSYSQAVADHVAFPIFVSDEDPYPGHGNVDVIQTVNSTWTLFSQFEITAVSNNTNWGTVRRQGNRIIASPSNGYYVVGFDVVDGTATVTRNNNIFVVIAESDCTIRINFAPRNPAVVHFSAPQGVSCEEDINAYIEDEITLPTPEGTPMVQGYSCKFLGWITAPMQEDSQDIPEFLSAGTKVQLTKDYITYYALYSYFVAADGLNDDQFVRVDAAPGSWVGEYVITYQGAYALGANSEYFGSSISNRLGTKKSVIDLAASGIVYENNMLSGVTDAMTYVIEPATNGTYTIKMKSVNHYLAMSSDADSLTSYTSSNSNKSRWIITYTANGPVLTNAQYSGRSIQYDDSNKYFQAFGSAKKALTLFAKADGDYWYTTVNSEDKLKITTQPVDVTVVLGENATFTVEATGDELSYQWQYKRANENTWYKWSGKTSASLTVTGKTTNNGCQYRCVVTNAAGSVNSDPATLTVVFLPVITTQPVDATVAVGESTTFTVAATGENLSYQWQYKRANENTWYKWSGKTSASLTVTGKTTNNGCQYRCVVTNAAGSVNSDPATLTVVSLPVITTQPVDATVAVGESTTFTVAATGENLSYQWQFKRANENTWYKWSGKTSASLTVTGKTTNNGCQYRCVVSNAAGSVNSNAATLTVESTPEDPEDGTIGKALGDYPTADACIKPNAFVDLIHTVQIWGAYDRTGNNTPDNTTDDTPAMLSIVSPLKSSAENYLSEGNIYMDDIDALYPENENKWVYQVEMTGNEIYYWLEFAASKLKKDSSGKIYVPSTQIKNYDVIMGEGFHYEIDMTKAAGERVFNMTYNGQTVKANQKFTVVMNSERCNSESPWVDWINNHFCDFYPEDRIIYSTETDMTNGRSEGHIRALLISYIWDQTAKNGGITPTIISDWSVRNGNN